MRPVIESAKLNHSINNLFLAFVPEGRAGLEVDEVAKRKKVEHDVAGKPLGLPQYHISLFSFGTLSEISSELVASISRVLQPLAAATEPFDVCFDRALSFDTRKRKLPFVLRSSRGNKPLVEFYRELALGQGIRRALNPHVTLFYDPKNISECSIDPVSWEVSELTLVRSYVGLGKHEHLARWPLRGVRCSHPQLDLDF
jgi:2'-5' RNA ligase